jgi:hypothetical protein
MEKLILAIISNENLWRHIPKEKVFERAVHLRDNVSMKKPRLEGTKLDRERKMFNEDVGACEVASAME